MSLRISLKLRPARWQDGQPPQLPYFPQWRTTELLHEDAWTRTYRASAEAASGDGEFAIVAARGDLTSDFDRELAIGLLAREAEVSGEVSHPHLVPTFSAHRSSQGEAWIVQPYLPGVLLPGETLDWPLPLKLWAIRQVAEALNALHSGGWLHGDVSPESIHVGSGGHATLVRLGWSRRLHSTESDLALTRFAGQMRYAAPEMFDVQGELSAAADIYSLGAVLFELVTERLFLEQYSGAELVAAKRLLATPTLPSDIPFTITSLVSRMLARQPLRRPTAQEVVEALVAAEVEVFGKWVA